jgi:dihydropyrimidine dehydrogenase (NAD+) subunit PreA
MNVNLGVRFCGVPFINPLTLASSPCTDAAEMIARGFQAGWAAAVFKTTSVETEEVSIAYPIMSSLHRGGRMVGLHNIDLISDRHIEAVTADVRVLKREFPDRVVIGSIEASTQAEWRYLAQEMAAAGADLIECGLSCPQGTILEGETSSVGSLISQDPHLTQKVARWVKEAVPNTPVYVKLTSVVADMGQMARSVAASGADGLCLIDSVAGIIGVDLETLEPQPSVGGFTSVGGYTGRAIKPVALRCIADAAQASKLPIAGVGGIYDWRDAAEFFLLGATVIQVCTAAMEQGFGIAGEILDGLTRWMARKDFTDLTQVIGRALPRVVDHERLPHGISVRARIAPARCIGCGRCYVACNDGGHQAIVWNAARQPVVDEDKCYGCGLCPEVCPVPQCITMRQRDE